MSEVYFFHTTKLAIVKKGYSPKSTIALKRVGDVFHYGISMCSKQDNFSKKAGREISLARLNHGFGTIEVPECLRTHTEKQSCIFQLKSIGSSLAMRSRKWKKKINRFNASLTIGEKRETKAFVSYPSITNKL